MRFRLLGLMIAVVLMATACNVDWTMVGFGEGHAGFTLDTSISKEAVQSGLALSWTGTYGPGPPAVVKGIVYDDRFTYDAAGVTNCSGDPKTCQPLWTLNTNNVESDPAVVNGVEYIGSDDHKLNAFDAAGVTNCSGIPKICQPLWTASTDGFVLSPTVVGGVVYVVSGFDEYRLYAFDAAGVTNCSGTPKACQPLWTATTGATVLATPAVAGGVVYLGSDKLYAFDAAGVTNCSGTPKSCQPLWTATTGGTVLATAVAGGVLYVDSGKLYAFDAAGVTNCSGTPKTCQPLWTASAGRPAVANGMVYAAAGGKINAFDAAGATNCTGHPKTCQPLWSALLPEASATAPAVANGVVYAGSSDEFTSSVSAFDAAGVTSCSGSPATCRPLWTTEVGGFGSSTSSPVVSGGAVYVAGNSVALYAFEPAKTPTTH